MSSVTASILIVAYQSGPDLARCLTALAAQTRRDFEVIIVDNASTDGAVEALPAYDWLRVDRCERNLGFAAGNNRAAIDANGRYLVTLNPDAFPEPGWLEALIATADRHPEAGSVASVQLLDSDPGRLDGLGDCYAPWGAAWRGGKGRLAVPVAESGIFGPCAAAALYRREAFDAVGGFCEAFFCYYEDVDLAIRLRRAGWTSVLSPWAIVRHVGSGSASSDFVLFHATRNRFWTYFRGVPTALMIGFLPVMLALAVAAVLVRVGRSSAGIRLRAVLAGLRDVPEQRSDRAGAVGPSTLLSALTWSPVAYLRRAVDARPIADLGRRIAEPPVDRTSVSAVVVTHDPDATVERVIAAALDQCHRVVVVDNASAPPARERLRALAQDDSRVALVENAENLGLAAAQNQGLVAARDTGCDWVLLLDDDSVPGPGMVDALLGGWSKLPDRHRVAVLAPRLTDAEGTLKPILLSSRTGFDLRRSPLSEGDVVRHAVFAIASGSLIRSGALEVAGPMAAPFFIDYIDIEFCLRLRRAGFEVVGIGDAVLHHRLGEFHETSVLGRQVALNTHTAWRRGMIHRNRVRVWRRHAGTAPAWLIFDIVAALYDVWKAAMYETDRRAKLGAILRGFRDGWRG